MGLRSDVILLAAVLGWGSPAAHAQSRFIGTINFSAAEKRVHLATLDVLLEHASRCLTADFVYHERFYRTNRVSPYYGSLSPYSKLTRTQRMTYLRDRRLDPALVDQIQSNSCIELALKCVGGAFAAQGQSAAWTRIRKFTADNGYDGTALQTALQGLGWRIQYWNPDLSQNAAWDAEEKRLDPTNAKRFWGYHVYRWATVQQDTHRYYLSVVNDWTTLVNFGRRPPAAFRGEPFFIGTSHGGYHVFPGAFGQIVEAHGLKSPEDSTLIESHPFNPLDPDGGPTGAYRSGLMLVPPLR